MGPPLLSPFVGEADPGPDPLFPPTFGFFGDPLGDEGDDAPLVALFVRALPLLPLLLSLVSAVDTTVGVGGICVRGCDHLPLAMWVAGGRERGEPRYFSSHPRPLQGHVAG